MLVHGDFQHVAQRRAGQFAGQGRFGPGKYIFKDALHRLANRAILIRRGMGKMERLRGLDRPIDIREGDLSRQPGQPHAAAGTFLGLHHARFLQAGHETPNHHRMREGTFGDFVRGAEGIRSLGQEGEKMSNPNRSDGIDDNGNNE